MKKQFKLLLVLMALSLCLTGCAGNKPQAKVKNFCDALKTLNYTKMAKSFEEDMFTEEDISDFYYEFEEMQMDDVFTSHAKNLQCKIDKAEIDEDDPEYATVDVTLTYDDFGELMLPVLDVFYKEFYEDETGDVGMERLAELMREALANEKGTRAEETITFYCEKVDGKWYVISDYDVFERVANAITCNMMDTYYDYEYEYDYDDYEEDDEDYWDEDVSDGDYEDFFEEDEDWENFDPETADEDKLMDYYLDMMDEVESNGAILVMNGYTINYDDEDYYTITGDLYDYDTYTAWRKIVGTDGNFEREHPDIYDVLDNGLWDENMEIDIPREAQVVGIWPEEEDANHTAIDDFEQLLNSGHAFVFFEDDYPDIYDVYDSVTNYPN